MPEPLPADATFEHLALPPMKIVSLLSSVQSQMGKWHGAVIVRLSLAGAGKLPVYRIERPNGKPLLTIAGSRGKPLVEDAAAGKDRRWSTATMSYEEVCETAMELISTELDKITAARPPPPGSTPDG